MSSSSGPVPSAAASPKPWVSLTRANLWKHDAGENLMVAQALRTDCIARRLAQEWHAAVLEFCPEPSAEAQSRELWARHGTYEERADCRSIVASESGQVSTERPWAEIFLQLSDSRRAELCGPGSVTAATRTVPLSARKRSLPGSSNTAEHLQEQISGLAGRLDDLEDFTGCLVGPDYSRSLARRLTRLENLIVMPAEP